MSITDENAENTPEVDVDTPPIETPEVDAPQPEVDVGAPEPEQLPQTYRVIGPQAVHHTAPGDTFTAVLDPDQEAFLLTVGHIEIAELPADETNQSA